MQPACLSQIFKFRRNYQINVCKAAFISARKWKAYPPPYRRARECYHRLILIKTMFWYSNVFWFSNNFFSPRTSFWRNFGDRNQKLSDFLAFLYNALFYNTRSVKWLKREEKNTDTIIKIRKNGSTLKTFEQGDQRSYTSNNTYYLRSRGKKNFFISRKIGVSPFDL